MPYILRLNNIKDASHTYIHDVCVAETEAEIVDFYVSQKVAPYLEPSTDPSKPVYSKHFIKGGPLEWFNPIQFNDIAKHIYYLPPFDEHIKKLKEHYDAYLCKIMQLEDLRKYYETKKEET